MSTKITPEEYEAEIKAHFQRPGRPVAIDPQALAAWRPRLAIRSKAEDDGPTREEIDHARLNLDKEAAADGEGTVRDPQGPTHRERFQDTPSPSPGGASGDGGEEEEETLESALKSYKAALRALVRDGLAAAAELERLGFGDDEADA